MHLLHQWSMSALVLSRGHTHPYTTLWCDLSVATRCVTLSRLWMEGLIFIQQQDLMSSYRVVGISVLNLGRRRRLAWNKLTRGKAAHITHVWESAIQPSTAWGFATQMSIKFLNRSLPHFNCLMSWVWIWRGQQGQPWQRWLAQLTCSKGHYKLTACWSRNQL